MARKSKFMSRNGKSTGYVVAFHVLGGKWNLIRGLTMTEAKEAMNKVTQWEEVEDAAILHVEDSWQRRFFDDETV